MKPNKKFSLKRIIIAIITLILLWIIIKIILPIGGAVVQIESTRNSLSHASTDGYLDIESPAKMGKKVHANFVDMPEPGFIIVFRPSQYTSNGQEDPLFLGATELLPKGVKENFDIPLEAEVKCTNITARLYKDLNGDGRFDFATEGESAPANMNGEAWILSPKSTYSIVQSFDVYCR